jgi:hypothetical protein
MQTATLSKAQARRFLARLHGLTGSHVLVGKEGALSYIRQCGCIQYDPIDVCGKNSELVLQSRIKGFTKAALDEMLYVDRSVIDHFDKNMAIYPVEDWPNLSRERALYKESVRSLEEVERVREDILAYLATHESVCSKDLDMNDKVGWYWSATKLSRAALEALYFRGELCVHHKKGAIKHYAPVARVLPARLLAMADANATDEAYCAWRTLRRIGAVGLLWNKRSDAYLCIHGHKDGGRDHVFSMLRARGLIIEVQVEGMETPLYARKENGALLEEILSGATYDPRMELIAPLDCLMWDRKLIEKLFDFSYTWEIYTPVEKRKYGYYVLPILYGEELVGRVEAVADRRQKALRVKGIWWEKKAYRGELRKCLKRFAKFNGCDGVDFADA